MPARVAAPHVAADRLDAACNHGLAITASCCSFVRSILKNGIERKLHRRATEGPAITQPNIRA
jgi:hypothetical protein|tara:strand:+ start:8819 stop:9007 length:189 start_codon:yes stop_codon:yes gene_type:complete